jgi:hypothetical protein
MITDGSSGEQRKSIPAVRKFDRCQAGLLTPRE